MKLSENYILKTVAGTAVVVPVGDAVNDIRGMITLNGPAETIWKCLENGMDDAPEDVLRNDLTAFIEKLKNYKIVSE